MNLDQPTHSKKEYSTGSVLNSLPCFHSYKSAIINKLVIFIVFLFISSGYYLWASSPYPTSNSTSLFFNRAVFSSQVVATNSNLTELTTEKCQKLLTEKGQVKQDNRKSETLQYDGNRNKAEELFKSNLLAREALQPQIDSGGQLWFNMAYLAPTWPCVEEVHVGNWGEGGKWVCNIPGAIPVGTGIVYSVGSNGDPSFEKSMYSVFGLKSYTFDPTLSAASLQAVSGLPYLEFYNIGLTGVENPEDDRAKFGAGVLAEGSKFMKIEEIMARLGHAYVDVFKIDCEGCEVSFVKHLAQVAVREKPFFGQIQIEIHDSSQNNFLPIVQVLEGLGYRLFHVEPNFWSHICWELAYIHETLARP